MSTIDAISLVTFVLIIHVSVGLGRALRFTWHVVDWSLAVAIKIAVGLLLFVLGMVFGRRRKWAGLRRTGMRSQDY